MSTSAESEVAAVAPEAPEVPKDLQARASGLLKPFDVNALAERIAIIQEAKKRCMTQGVHYGPAFGKNAKDTLLKPGAEVLCQIFGLGAHLKLSERPLEANHTLYTVRATMYDLEGGLRVIRGYGTGCCTTMEHKYRSQTEPRTGDDGKLYPSKYTAFDFYNVCLKIAEKRAYVDGAIRASGASAVFTQDADEDPEKFRALNGEGSQGPAVRPYAPKPNGNPSDPLALPADWEPGRREEITGDVVRAWPNDYQGKRYYFAKLKDGKQLQATDPAIGEEFLKKAGQTLRALVEHSPKPGKYYFVAFARDQASAPAAAVEGSKPEPKPVPPPPPQSFAGVVDQAWKQGEPGHYTYLVRVGGIHLQTRAPELGERLLAMQGQMLKAVARPGSQPRTMDFIRFDEPPTVVENPAADRVGRRKAAKAKHEAKGKVPEGQTA